MFEYKWIELHKIEVVNIKRPDFTDQEFVQGISREELVKERMVHAEDKDLLLTAGYSDVGIAVDPLEHRDQSKEEEGDTNSSDAEGTGQLENKKSIEAKDANNELSGENDEASFFEG